MANQLTQRRTNIGFLKPLVSGILGMTLLLPASFFMMVFMARVFLGTKSLYYYFAPSFLQSPFDPLAWHKAQVILGSLLLAIILNVLTIVKIQVQKGNKGWEVQLSYRRRWLNMAIVLQGILLLVILLAYTMIQHIRY